MIDRQIKEKPKCVKCGKPALGLVSDIWLCGEHIIELQQKLKKLKSDLLIYG